MSDYTIIAGTPGPAPGVCVLSFTSTSPGEIKLTEKQVITTDVGPQWITTSPAKSNRLLFAHRTGLRLFDISPDSEGIQFNEISRFSPHGAVGICHASFSNDGKFIVAADFPGGRAGSFHLDGDRITGAVTSLTYEGDGGVQGVTECVSRALG